MSKNTSNNSSDIDSYIDDVLSSTSAYNNIIPTGHKGKRRQVKEMVRQWQKTQVNIKTTSVKYTWKDYHNAVC
jgi:hypothetical protein